jgi:hypothetical protein
MTETLAGTVGTTCTRTLDRARTVDPVAPHTQDHDQRTTCASLRSTRVCGEPMADDPVGQS